MPEVVLAGCWKTPFPTTADVVIRKEGGESMRGDDGEQGSMFSYRSLEERIPRDHPLRPMRAMVDEVLEEVSPLFAELYTNTGRPSIPPERLLRALLLQILFPCAVSAS
jgi:transposase